MGLHQLQLVGAANVSRRMSRGRAGNVWGKESNKKKERDGENVQGRWREMNGTEMNGKR